MIRWTVIDGTSGCVVVKITEALHDWADIVFSVPALLEPMWLPHDWGRVRPMPIRSMRLPARPWRHQARACRIDRCRWKRRRYVQKLRRRAGA